MTGRELDPAEIVDRLGLSPHPEGGFYAETYRADETLAADALPDRYGADRNVSTAIYYLLMSGTCAVMHRVASDEIFHFYLGDSVEMLHLYPDGGARTPTLGTDLAAGELPQVIVPRGVWQGARLRPGGRCALMGTTVAPGFQFDDFEFGSRAELIAAFPDHADLISALMPEDARPQ
jgi:predicted cupin superfamily sugar epimerase